MENVLYGWANSEAYLEPSGISKMEHFISAKASHHVVITYMLGERFSLGIFSSLVVPLTRFNPMFYFYRV